MGADKQGLPDFRVTHNGTSKVEVNNHVLAKVHATSPTAPDLKATLRLVAV